MLLPGADAGCGLLSGAVAGSAARPAPGACGKTKRQQHDVVGVGGPAGPP